MAFDGFLNMDDSLINRVSPIGNSQLGANGYVDPFASLGVFFWFYNNSVI